MSNYRAGVYIDDAGTPGVRSKSRYLHQDRKSWAAIIIPPDREAELRSVLNVFLDGVRQDFDARELHFTDIYGGRGSFEDIEPVRRFEIIDLMAGLFETFDIPILYQTSSSKLLEEHAQIVELTDIEPGWFNLKKHEHFSLFLLCNQVAGFIRGHRHHFPGHLQLVVDEGLAKKGASIELPGFDDVFLGRSMCFEASDECMYLQLADFAAFAISRSQWLQAKGDLKDHDLRFLEMVSPDRLSIMNLPVVRANIDEITTEAYDQLLEMDRTTKGFDDP